MIQEGLVSVILPYYNGQAFIREALESVRAQTFTNFELLLVDDGSPDAKQSEYVKELIASYRDERFRYFHKPNGGLSNARNFGYAQSRGSHIAFLDQDDLWRPEKLEVQMGVFRANPAVEFIFTNGTAFGEASPKLRRRASIREGIIKDSYCQMLRGNVVSALTVMFTRTLVDRVGLSNPRYAVCPDYEYFLRMSEFTDFYFIDRPLADYRIHAENTSKQLVRGGAEVLCILSERRKTSFKQKWWANYYYVKQLGFLLRDWLKQCWLGGR
ncbi:MAG: glycosyltransferase [Elusimicrobia bacterium]|nr:glycosyltransferase [Elusimicrobiota bacterium]